MPASISKTLRNQSGAYPYLSLLQQVHRMVHQIFAGIGAYGGALIFDATGSYDAVFVFLLAASGLALVLSLRMRHATLPAPANA